MFALSSLKQQHWNSESTTIFVNRCQQHNHDSTKASVLPLFGNMVTSLNCHTTQLLYFWIRSSHNLCSTVQVIHTQH